MHSPTRQPFRENHIFIAAKLWVEELQRWTVARLKRQTDVQTDIMIDIYTNKHNDRQIYRQI